MAVAYTYLLTILESRKL